MMLGDVRERIRAGDVADDMNAWIGRRQHVVDDDAAVVDVHAGRVEAEAFDVRQAPGGEHQMRRGELLDRAVRRAQRHADAAGVRMTGHDAADADAEAIADTLRLELPLHDSGDVGVFARQDLVRHVDDDHLAAEATERLRHFAADRSGADDDEMRHRLAQREHRLVRQVRDVREPGDRRNRRAASRSRSRNASR